jgi:hypothetical protein
MRLGRRYGLSAAQKTEIWRRWKAGESLHEIGRAHGKDHGSIHFLSSQHGGIVPAVRRRSERTLMLAVGGRRCGHRKTRILFFMRGLLPGQV